MKFRPCIDIHDGKVKQIVGGSLSDDNKNLKENFISDKTSAYYAELFKKDKLFGGHIIMLGKNNEKAALEAIHAYSNGMQVGGGINMNNAQFYLNEGASHVIVTSYVFNDGNIDFKRLDSLASLITPKKLVLDLSCRKKDDGCYYVVTDRWQKFTNFKLTQANITLLSDYCDEFLIHGVDVEGKKSGIEVELVEWMGQYCSIKATYAGGIRSIEDIKLIERLGDDKIDFTVGSALDIFGGNLSYDDLVKYK